MVDAVQAPFNIAHMKLIVSLAGELGQTFDAQMNLLAVSMISLAKHRNIPLQSVLEALPVIWPSVTESFYADMTIANPEPNAPSHPTDIEVKQSDTDQLTMGVKDEEGELDPEAKPTVN